MGPYKRFEGYAYGKNYGKTGKFGVKDGIAHV